MTKNDFILASSSIQRRDLLTQINLHPIITIAPNIDESLIKGELPVGYVKRITSTKAQKIAYTHTDQCVLSADTVVCCGRRILFKTTDHMQARNHLRLLSGRRHRVYTCVCVMRGEKSALRNVMSVVKFKRLENREIEDYLLGNEWQNKAGAYSIQGIAGSFIPWFRGSYSAIVGLPLYETICLLKGFI